MSLQPPPRSIEEFTKPWKDWLYFLYEQVLNRTTLKVTEVSTTYTTLSTDEVIHADPASGAFNITLETGTANRRLYIKNVNITNANTVTVAGTIDNNTNFTLTPMEALHLSYNVTKSSWMII
jgi:hypothetical protein